MELVGDVFSSPDGHITRLPCPMNDIVYDSDNGTDESFEDCQSWLPASAWEVYEFTHPDNFVSAPFSERLPTRRLLLPATLCSGERASTCQSLFCGCNDIDLHRGS